LTFTPGQMRIRQEIGHGEIAYDVTGIKFQRLRNDFFRHMILGLGALDWLLSFLRISAGVGAGDLIIVVPRGGSVEQIEFPNVFRMNARVDLMEKMLQEKIVVSSSA